MGICNSWETFLSPTDDPNPIPSMYGIFTYMKTKKSMLCIWWQLYLALALFIILSYSFWGIFPECPWNSSFWSLGITVPKRPGKLGLRILKKDSTNWNIPTPYFRWIRNNFCFCWWPFLGLGGSCLGGLWSIGFHDSCLHSIRDCWIGA